MVRLVDDGLRVRGGAEIEAACGHAANHTRLRGQSYQIDDLLLRGNAGDTLGHAYAEIDDAVSLELHGGAACDDLPFAHCHLGYRAHGGPYLAAIRGAVRRRERLPMMLRLLRDNDAVNQNPRNLDIPRVQTAAVRKALDLDDYDPAGVANRHGDCESFQGQCLPLHCDIPIGIRSRTPDHPYGDWKCLVKKVLLSSDRKQLDQIFGRARINLASSESRVHESAKADAS